MPGTPAPRPRLPRPLLVLALLLLIPGPARAQQPSQVHLYCINGQADLRLTRQPEGRSICLIRSFGHDSTARDWARNNLPEGRRCTCN